MQRCRDDADPASQGERVSRPRLRPVRSALRRCAPLRACDGAGRAPLHHGRAAPPQIFPERARAYPKAPGRVVLDRRADPRLVPRAAPYWLTRVMKVHIHGNCQSFVLSHMLKEVCPDWDITFYEVHAEPIMQNLADYRALIGAADIVLSQPIHNGYRDTAELSLSWIRDHVKPSAALIVIPALHFSGHHPEFAALARLGDLCQNSVAAHLTMIGMAPDRAVDLLLSTDLFDDAIIRTEIDLQLLEMNRRETSDRIDASVADIVTSQAVWFQMFHIVNHP